MKTVSVNYSKHQAQEVIAGLIEEGRWFQVEPLPFDVFMVAVKPERPLPVAVGANGLGFEEWLYLVERHFIDGLTQEGREEFRNYFLRGLTPSEAIFQDREDQEA